MKIIVGEIDGRDVLATAEEGWSLTETVDVNQTWVQTKVDFESAC